MLKHDIRRFLFTLAVVLTITSAAATERGFAIFIDSISYKEAAAEVEAYAASVKKQGLKPYVIIDRWKNPDSIRTEIRRLAALKSSPIEGMVFIGDIPVAMIRDAQHLTSAFKIDQNMKNFERTACPSDRFYDDLNLQFEFIKRDGKKPNLFYYSLLPESPQVSHPTLYSGRIKSFAYNGKTEYERLRDYLKKVVRLKEKGDTLMQLLYFSGHGYNSESQISRIDEKTAYYEYFPWMRRQNSAITYIDHKMAKYAKYLLMSQLQRPDLSLAILHHHGGVEAEYINRTPDARSVTDNLEAAKMFFRSKIRTAVERGGDKEEVKARYAREYDVPLDWFDDIFTPESIAADSIFNDRIDLHIYDLGRYKPNARVVMLDACFNGAFNNEKYIAGGYIFEDGDCVVTIANSVNSLQDKWCDANIGLLGYGMRVGNFVKYNPYLESHIIGDPTFSFIPATELAFDINDALCKGAKFWRKQLTSQYPAIQMMALRRLTLDNVITSDDLLSVFKTSPDGIVRMAALMMLSEKKGENFVKCISLGLNDEYELVRRFSAIFAGKNGSPELIPSLIKATLNEGIGKRVKFQLSNALALYSYDAMLKYYLSNDLCSNKITYEDDDFDFAEDLMRTSDKRRLEEFALLSDPKTDRRDAKLLIKSLRNNPQHTAVPLLLNFLNTTEDEELQYMLVEALGWFNYSYRAQEIAAALQKTASDARFSSKVQAEATKSINRLTSASSK